jgi:hypothetical protein
MSNAMASKGISVKVKRAKLLDMMVEALARLEKQLVDYKAMQDENSATAKREHAIMQKAIKSGAGTITEFDARSSSWDDAGNRFVSVRIALPLKKFPRTITVDENFSQYDAMRGISALKSAIKLLGISEVEEVSTTSYAGVVEYL